MVTEILHLIKSLVTGLSFVALLGWAINQAVALPLTGLAIMAWVVVYFLYKFFETQLKEEANE